MKKIAAMLCVFLLASSASANPPEGELVQKLTSVITKLCPKAEIKVDKFAFSAKHDTMVYTLHSRLMTGEVHPSTYREEGPRFKGFMLRVTLHDGKYGGQARVPQTHRGPYFPTFMDAPSIDPGKKHYRVDFSYGGGLDPKLKNAILEAIPRTRPRQHPELDK